MNGPNGGQERWGWMKVSAGLGLAALGWPAPVAAHPGHGVVWPVHLHAEQVAVAMAVTGVVVLALWKAAGNR